MRTMKRKLKPKKFVDVPQEEVSRITVEDFEGKKYPFNNQCLADAFTLTDSMENVIREKYFDTDLEYVEGVKMAQKMKAQIRRLEVDLENLMEIRYNGLPSASEDETGF
jgi:hypothetical protein